MLRYIAGIFLAGLAGVCLASGAANAQELDLKIVTSANEPVYNALVTLGYTTRTTDKAGVLRTEVPSEGDYQVAITWRGERYFCNVSTGANENRCVVGR